MVAPVHEEAEPALGRDELLLGRLEAFSDDVFAIALLVLELGVTASAARDMVGAGDQGRAPGLSTRSERHAPRAVTLARARSARP